MESTFSVASVDGRSVGGGAEWQVVPEELLARWGQWGTPRLIDGFGFS